MTGRMVERELVIVGAGPAGMAAALSARENGVDDILLLERDQFLGGILNQCVHTGFGLNYFKEVLTGPEYAQRFIERIQKAPGIEVSLKSFVVNLTPEKVLTFLKPGRLEIVKAKCLIMATGCREKTREMVHISGTRPAGIFSAGLAQKLINIEGLLPGNKVVVVGSGDIGLIMARRFVLEGAQVQAVVEIQSKSRGLLRNLVQCVYDFEIPIYFNHKIANIYGQDRIEKVKVVRVDDNFSEVAGTEFELDCDTLLVSVGLIPENELIEMAGALLDKKSNSPVTDSVNKTTIPGLFVCGNSFKVYDVADSVTQDSELCGKMAAQYLRELP